MTIDVNYDEAFSEKELEKLKEFEVILKEEWIKNANSTSNLEWFISVTPTEPRLHANLSLKGRKRVLHTESVLSVLDKSMDDFYKEFIELALKYK